MGRWNQRRRSGHNERKKRTMFRNVVLSTEIFLQAFKSKLGELKTLTKSLMIRVKETDLRPKKIAELNEIVNTTQHFLRGAQRLFETAEEDDKPLTSTDLKSLEKILDETKVRRIFHRFLFRQIFTEISLDVARKRFVRIRKTSADRRSEIFVDGFRHENRSARA